MKKVLVIIPTYNEAENIDQVINCVEQVASKSKVYKFSLLVVDDKSPDGTAKLVKRRQKRSKNIYILSGNKAGLGKAYLRGLKNALDSKGLYALIMMDGDMSHNPADIPALLKVLDNGADYVIGSRYTSGGSIVGSWPLHRKLLSRCANFLARKLVGIDESVTDITGGFKAIRVSALSQIDLDSINASGYVFLVSLLHAFLSKGFEVTEVPITFLNREYGDSKLGLRDIIEFVYRAYKLNPAAPIQKFVRFGFVGACGSVVNLLVLSLLVKILHLDALIAIIFAIEVSIIFNFFLNHYYTFKGYGSYAITSQNHPSNLLPVKLMKYNIGALGGALISFVSFTFFYKALGFNYIISDILGIAIAMTWNFFISTRYVWKIID